DYPREPPKPDMITRPSHIPDARPPPVTEFGHGNRGETDVIMTEIRDKSPGWSRVPTRGRRTRHTEPDSGHSLRPGRPGGVHEALRAGRVDRVEGGAVHLQAGADDHRVG